MKNYQKVTALIATMSIMSCFIVSCEKTEKNELTADSIIDVSTVAPIELDELPRGEYECYELDYLSGIKDITGISPLNNNRFLVISEECSAGGEAYGALKYQKLYIADDTNKSVTEITPNLNVNETAYSSAMGTRDGKIFIAVIEPEYSSGKDPGHDEEENFAQDHIDFLFNHAKNVNYKLFEINTSGEVISKKTIDIDYNRKRPINWLICDDYWNGNIVITGIRAYNGEKNAVYYIITPKGTIKREIENYISYYGPTVRKATSDGRFCMIGTDYDATEPADKIYFYDKESSKSTESYDIKCVDFGCESRSSSLVAGTIGHGNDLLYLSSDIGLFSYDTEGNYENIINYINLTPNNTEIQNVLTLDNNKVLVLGRCYLANEGCTKTKLFAFTNITANN
ncbi:hypothetical protein [Ruminococcus flavefaciens]|uniref:Uncharacterized protein n=1 Tax=Ruminococcus flavefaciens TaxID=1265 RepID=A0A1M7IDL5_RUMFL|nr:hypothetical protein [Ruminococcus flavefaciens]SHM38683.1 hypothetical protein SAMN04487860_10452 [Ruminococcus flavefaciens]